MNPTARRLMSAELLKLRRRRGLVFATLGLTVVPMVIASAVLIVQHASDPAAHGPAGGVEHFAGTVGALAGLGVVAGILVGATLGAGDLGAGVFRELVVTGRSRLALFTARVPAGLAFLMPILGAAFALTATISILLAGSQETQTIHDGLRFGDVAPSASALLGAAGWLALVTAAGMVLALGVSSFVGSRSTSIAILLAWWLVAMPLVLNLEGLGSLRKGLLTAAMERLMPHAVREGPPVVSMSLITALVVLLAWIAVPVALGAWRTRTRDA
jgi:hypothetical protein